MRFILALSLVVILSGCSLFRQPVPVVPKFPEATPELLKKCEELRKVEGDQVLITELLRAVVYNYSLYYQCSAKVEGWQEWYETQKKIYENIK